MTGLMVCQLNIVFSQDVYNDVPDWFIQTQTAEDEGLEKIIHSVNNHIKVVFCLPIYYAL